MPGCLVGIYVSLVIPFLGWPVLANREQMPSRFHVPSHSLLRICSALLLVQRKGMSKICWAGMLPSTSNNSMHCQAGRRHCCCTARCAHTHTRVPVSLI